MYHSYAMIFYFKWWGAVLIYAYFYGEHVKKEGQLAIIDFWCGKGEVEGFGGCTFKVPIGHSYEL